MNADQKYFPIKRGTIYDPANGLDGEVRDLWTSYFQFVVPPANPAASLPDRLDGFECI